MVLKAVYEPKYLVTEAYNEGYKSDLSERILYSHALPSATDRLGKRSCYSGSEYERAKELFERSPDTRGKKYSKVSRWNTRWKDVNSTIRRENSESG